jgi:hypothetical protein
MAEVEKMVATRVRVGGRDEDRPTGNFVYAEFVHLTARPEGGIPDPHLHLHCYAFNVTMDPVEKRWKAAQFGDVKEAATYFQGACMMRVKENLQKLGLEIVPTKDAFEIMGISKELRDKFSKRTKTIEEYAKAHGITDPVEKAKIAAFTRENKDKDLTIPELGRHWWPRLAPKEREALEGLKTLLQRSRRLEPEFQPGISESLGKRQNVRISMNRATMPVESLDEAVAATEHDRRAVALAAQHLLERESVITEHKLMGEAFKSWCVGKATIGGIKRAVAEAPFLRVERDGKILLTTAEVLAEETRCVDACIAGKGSFEAMNPDWHIQNRKLNKQQREAVLHVLKSEDFVVGIRGKAGTGKTMLLHEAERGIEASHRKLVVLAPTAEAARDVLRKQGFENAETVAKLLASKALQEEARGAVWWVDEAGLLSMHSMDKLLELAKQSDARVVLVGDTGQHHAVERGQAFKLLQDFGEMEVASVDEIQRQRGTYKHIVELAEARETKELFELMTAANFIWEGTIEERQKQLAQDYLSIMEKGKSALVVAPSHLECQDVTEGIREALKQRGVLKKGKDWEILRNLSWTNAEKSDPEHYEEGLVVQINGHVKGYSLGEKLEVVSVTESTVLGRSEGRFKEIPLATPKAFGVYERGSIELCEGDRIRITGNHRTADEHAVINGSLFTVKRFDHQGRIVLDNGWRLDKDFGHLRWGYAVTSFTSQSKDVDWVLVAQSPEMSYGASGANQFYVSLSRGREGVRVYTTSIEGLQEMVSLERERLMATEVLQAEEMKTAMDAAKVSEQKVDHVATQELVMEM